VRAIADARWRRQFAETVGAALVLIADGPEGGEERSAEGEERLEAGYRVRRPGQAVSQQERCAEECGKQEDELGEKEEPDAGALAERELFCGESCFRREEEDSGNHEAADQETEGKTEDELMAVERGIG